MQQEKTAVHVTTPAQWDEVLRVEKPGHNYVTTFHSYLEDVCIGLDPDSTFSSRRFYESQGFAILTFEQWQARWSPEPDFSAERYQRQVVDAGTHEVQTRRGQPVRVLCTDQATNEWTVIGLAAEKGGRENIVVCRGDGTYGPVCHPSDSDLLIVPKPPQPVTLELAPDFVATIDYVAAGVQINDQFVSFDQFARIREIIDAQPC